MLINLRAISLEISQPSVTKISLKIIFLRIYWNLPGGQWVKFLFHWKYSVHKRFKCSILISLPSWHPDIGECWCVGQRRQTLRRKSFPRHHAFDDILKVQSHEYQVFLTKQTFESLWPGDGICDAIWCHIFGSNLDLLNHCGLVTPYQLVSARQT